MIPPDLPSPPREPAPEECCGRGCEPCIFDYYERALERWEARIRERGLDPDDLRRA
ncbi:oxidoreductase-like domain-containing protein [Phenylobacterium sp. VNQ135]|uniref:oxidoreductase-like domain-containing protein n=1 Tax=Phenylobacterium sp. VNQ135 TaxID=3400922 RepID=UPI003C105157